MHVHVAHARARTHTHTHTHTRNYMRMRLPTHIRASSKPTEQWHLRVAEGVGIPGVGYVWTTHEMRA